MGQETAEWRPEPLHNHRQQRHRRGKTEELLLPRLQQPHAVPGVRDDPQAIRNRVGAADEAQGRSATLVSQVTSG